MSDEPKGITIRAKLQRKPKGRRRVVSRPVDATPAPAVEDVPRAARLLAQAIVFEEMVRTGEVESYAEIARQAGVSRAHISKFTALLQLAPEVQTRLIQASDQSPANAGPT